MDTKFRSRKWLITLLTFGVSTVLLVNGYIDGTIWRDVAIMVGGAYMASQAYVDRNVKK